MGQKNIVTAVVLCVLGMTTAAMGQSASQAGDDAAAKQPMALQQTAEVTPVDGPMAQSSEAAAQTQAQAPAATSTQAAAKALPNSPAAQKQADIDAVEAATARVPANVGDFWARLKQAYAWDWHGNGPKLPDAPRLGWPAPVNMPPFPFADWPYGGSPVLGTADTTAYPLMQAIYGGKNGQAWMNSHVKIYGWFNGGFNVSTSNAGKFANAPASYYVIPNSIQFDQATLYIERDPNEAQLDHFDWGFRLTNLYGLDYRFTTAKGIFSQQLLKNNNTYGYDPVMFYIDLWVPKVAQGMNIRIGRYISLPDIEAQLAPNNYTYSHSLLYSFDAYTQTGINATIRFSNHWLLQTGLSAGNDVAPWTSDAQLTGNVCAAYYWNTGGDDVYVCANSFNKGKYAYNNLQSYYATWYHKINSSWHTDTESWYMYERDVPNVAGNVTNPLPTEPGANGAICEPGQLTCYAPEWAIVNYFEKDFNNHHDGLTIRNEYFNDIRGQRTGTKTQYSEHLIGLSHNIGTTITFRPEVRFEHSYDANAYDLGKKSSQFIVAGDIIYHF
jgi:hypothetical protein